MVLHEYAVKGHRRSEVGRFLGIAAVLLAPAVTWLITWAYEWITQVGSAGVAPTMGEQALHFTVRVGLIYVVLHYFFDHVLWKKICGAMNLPNVGGEWAIKGESLELDGTVRFQWEGVLDITQTWEMIGIRLRTKQSTSDSDSATLTAAHNGEAHLSYTYRNEPNAGEVELSTHTGACALDFNKDGNTATGSYYNTRGRTTYGKMTLTKIEKSEAA